MLTAPLRKPVSIILAISAISAGRGDLVRRVAAGRNVLGSCITAIRTGMWPMLTP